VVSFYSAEIFKDIGLEEKTWAVYASILVTFVETVMHGLTMFLIDRTGRRFLLIMGMIGMSVCCFALAVVRIVSV
jgi:MFS family permease